MRPFFYFSLFCSVSACFFLFFFRFAFCAKDGENAPRPDWLPEGCEMLADGEYDAIVMGTGLKEAIMSGLLSTLGMKVRFFSLHDIGTRFTVWVSFPLPD